MSFSYDPTDLATELNHLRLKIGDTDENDPLLQDEEIAFVQSQESSFYMRASVCCKLIVSHLAREVNFKIGNFSEDAKDAYLRYKEMEKEFLALASESYPWAGGVVKSDKESIRTDDALVQPKFRKGMNDHP
jgi:hypothetical protein